MADPSAVTRSVKRLAVVAPDASSILRQRSDLLSAVMARRHSVMVLLPETEMAGAAAIEARGMAVASFPMRGAVPHVLADGKSVTSLAATFADWRAHAVLAYGLKPMLLAGQAAQKAHVNRKVALVTSLPATVVTAEGTGTSWGWRRLLKGGFRSFDTVACHNQDQKARLEAGRWLKPGTTVTVVGGAGVDLTRNDAKPLPPLFDGAAAALNFLMVARKDEDKGVVDFCEAARIVRAKAPDAQFVLAGADGGVDRARLAGFADAVRMIDDQGDVRPLIAAAHVVVAPPHHDGPPRVLLEALAAGRPVIASAIPGNRETIDERVNGVLVPPGDAAALAEAMTSFLKRPDLIPAMARASRSKAERRFDVNAVNATLLGLMGL